MNTAQTQLYWRAWAAVVRVHNWRGTGEALAATYEACWISPELNASVYQPIWNAASGLAYQKNRRSLTAEDLRHACHIVALNRNASSKHFTNADLDRVLALLRLLADPNTLRNVEAWQNEEAGERCRLVYVIKQAPPAYFQKIAHDKFGTADLAQLTLEQLRQLSLTLRSRLAAREPITAPQPAAVAVPFPLPA